jgi:hypothetical protein
VTAANSASAASRSSTISCAITSGGREVLEILERLVAQPDEVEAHLVPRRQGAPVRRLHDELANGGALRGGQVDSARILHRPACGSEHAIDLDPGLRLGRQVREPLTPRIIAQCGRGCL